ncbi:MAG: DUF2812 domain-containing protein [Clostridium sp.]
MKKIRYFLDLDAQEKWLNNEAKKGNRLIKANKLIYVFEKCNQSEYEYKVEFVGNKSLSEMIKYKEFLESIGYKIFNKNLNLNYSIFKFKFRPYADKHAKIATNPGVINKELFIVEVKKTDNKFELHTEPNDLICYYLNIRNMYLSILAILLFIPIMNIAKYGKLYLLILLPPLIYIVYKVVKYNNLLKKYKNN